MSVDFNFPRLSLLFKLVFRTDWIIWFYVLSVFMLDLPAIALSPQAEDKAFIISRLRGDVRFIDSISGCNDAASRRIVTGTGCSWCEFQMNNCTARLASDSQVDILPSNRTIRLSKGAIIVQARGNARAYSVESGDLVCRLQSNTLRVQQCRREVSFEVLDGRVTVCDRLTGETFSSSQVVCPLR